ncbi:MAG: hypothetical protein PHQ81_03400 [Methanofollis sp.]|nr:hypothetical protein [Methanofollis sp.]
MDRHLAGKERVGAEGGEEKESEEGKGRDEQALLLDIGCTQGDQESGEEEERVIWRGDEEQEEQAGDYEERSEVSVLSSPERFGLVRGPNPQPEDPVSPEWDQI